MTNIPATGYFNDVARTNSEAKDAQDAILAILRETPGGAAETTLTIAAGSVTPTGAVHAIDTEAAASTDDLANIAQTNHPDGRWLLIRAADGTRDVVAKHQAGGAGQISLAAAADFTLDATDKFLLVKRNGALWEEVLRGFGADAAAERAFLGLTYANQAEAEAGTATGTVMDPLRVKQAIDKLGASKIVQVVNVQTGAVATGTTIIPSDDTVPQNTEGDEYMTLAITPTAVASRLLIQVTIVLAHTVTSALAFVALYQDATVTALKAAMGEFADSGSPQTITFTHVMPAGATSLTTFKVRAGSSSAGTTTFNGAGGGRKLGGVLASSITIWEIAA